MAEELEPDRGSNEAYEYYRAHARDKRDRGLGMLLKPFEPPAEPRARST